MAARDKDADTAHAYADEAARIAALTGERNTFRQHFGATNVAVWRVAIGAKMDSALSAELRTEVKKVLGGMSPRV